MPAAIGTSLVILTINSLAGLAAHLGPFQLDLGAAVAFLGAAALAALVAAKIADRLPERVLRHGFAALVLAVAVFVAVQTALGTTPTTG